jgi:hypothetical protein
LVPSSSEGVLTGAKKKKKNVFLSLFQKTKSKHKSKNKQQLTESQSAPNVSIFHWITFFKKRNRRADTRYRPIAVHSTCQENIVFIVNGFHTVAVFAYFVLDLITGCTAQDGTFNLNGVSYEMSQPCNEHV